MTDQLNHYWKHKVIELNKTGLSTTGAALTECFMIAQQSGRGNHNQHVLSRRLRMATPEQRNAALNLFDEFCKSKGV